MGLAKLRQRRSPDNVMTCLPVQHTVTTHLALKGNSSNDMLWGLLFTSVHSGLASVTYMKFCNCLRKRHRHSQVI